MQIVFLFSKLCCGVLVWGVVINVVKGPGCGFGMVLLFVAFLLEWQREDRGENESI